VRHGMGVIPLMAEFLVASSDHNWKRNTEERGAVCGDNDAP
jgi:hypothetical protein